MTGPETSQGIPINLVADFAGADEILATGQMGRLAHIGQVAVLRSGRIGPLVEIAAGRRVRPSAYANVATLPPLVPMLDRALTDAVVSGLDPGSRLGIFPLRLLGPEGTPTDEWILWFSRADQAARAAGFSSSVAALIVGAFGELQDNVFRQSQGWADALVAFAVTQEGFELVVSDSGVGVRDSLRTHPDYKDIPDAGAALRVALANGESRFGRASGCGLGIGQIFRALASQDGDLRFRSDDYALEIRGYSPTLQGDLELRHKASLPGLTVSVLCRPFGRRAN